MSRALGGNGRNTARCPSHQDRSPSLSLGEARDGTPLAYCHAGCDGRDVLAELRRLGFIIRNDEDATAATVVEPMPEPDRTNRLAKARAIWARTRTITADDTAGRYLEARACALPMPGADLRWMPPRPPRHPLVTLVGRVTAPEDAGGLRTLHFTPIRADGTRGDRRLMAGLSSKGVIRLCDDPEAVGGLFVAEGIETALVGPQPAWATINANNLTALPVLAGFDCLSIAVDADDAGRRAAERCAARWHAAGVEVRLVEPGGADGS